MENPILTAWHVLYVRYQQEKKVESLLQEKDIDVFLPMIKYINIWSDRKKKIYKPLFNSYVFVRTTTKREFYNALDTDGVVKYLKFGDDYALVRPKEISQIKQLINIEDISEIEIASNTPIKGQKMKINYGPLKGLDCEVLKAKQKSQILVKINSIRHHITASIPNCYLAPTTYHISEKV